MSPEHEITRRKREVTELKAERGVLKPTAAYFAKEFDVSFAFIRSTGGSGRRDGCAGRSVIQSS
jgi:hypothetical protein